ncbi:MAG TPA: rhomboid family intramembrane serine protease [Spirochaetota bacterium]|nr:rhomboid family intramembrane serine protease [Spirochaetota bacterium]HPC39417.1 rhomboid family intramembrane serine protease [Spirochaetota bacterium]HPL17301.1 rhomboid family intramembrane serine protease [Spirochaetota bacterium]HQF06754.1 rhomboid family intramembrane serine protease [Spirochaetota bacterium]HQH95627.1 rhomboid family intramembrane serine protease [Spirochaetota bacterium]
MNGTETYTKSWVIRLIILNIAIFFGLQLMLSMVGTGEEGSTLSDVLIFYLGLRPVLVIEKYYLWQLFTYMFLHGGFLHIFLNMYALLIFGIPVEQAWGSRRFLFYYVFTGVGAGVTILVINTLLGGVNYITPTIGASGAVFGLLLAFGMLFPDAEILIFFIIPMRAKFLVLLYGGLELYSLVASSGQSPVSHAGHLGGIIFGLIFFLIIRKRGISFKSKLIKARLNREIDRHETRSEKEIKQNDHILESILEKLKTRGPGSITDDEYQHIRYMEIMTQDNEELCVEEDFDANDEFCTKCAHREACLLRQIKKYL